MKAFEIVSKLAYTQWSINKPSFQSGVSFVGIDILVFLLASFPDKAVIVAISDWQRLYTSCAFPPIRFITTRHFHELYLNKAKVFRCFFLVSSIFLSPTVSLDFIAIIASFAFKITSKLAWMSGLVKSCFVDLFLPLSPNFVIRELKRRYETKINHVEGYASQGLKSRPITEMKYSWISKPDKNCLMIKDSTLFLDVLTQNGKHLFQVFKLTKERNENSICLYRIKQREYYRSRHLQWVLLHKSN